MAFIETERLLLRTWMPTDAPAFDALSREVDARRYGSIDQAIHEQEHEGFSIWPVVRKDAGALVGCCGLHRTEDGEVEVAWVFAPEAWGQGFATEAARAAIDFGTSALHLKSICALVAPMDRASVAVAGRLHMRFDRVVRAYRRDLLKYTTLSS